MALYKSRLPFPIYDYNVPLSYQLQFIVVEEHSIEFKLLSLAKAETDYINVLRMLILVISIFIFLI